MSENQIKERVFKVVSNIMGVSLREVDENSSPDTLEKWDSLQHMNLILALEEEFGVQFTDSQIVDMLNVQLIIMTVEELCQERHDIKKK